MIIRFQISHDNVKHLSTLQKNLSPNPSPFRKLLLYICVTLAVVFFALKPFIEFDNTGVPKLATWREEKLNRELKNLESAEQYVLLVVQSGMYPCYSCVDSATIFLKTREVYRYGITTKGKQGRYGSSLGGRRLQYVIQFEGTIEECLKEERRKIYAYALFPENLKRKNPLIRPPGNKKDS